jgi:hypothetical protein
MIPMPTVMVLGAGASKPYGFPLGRELRDMIRDRLELLAQYPMLYGAGVSSREIEALRDVLDSSPYESIDEILGYRPDIADVGRKAIAEALTVSQHHGRLFPPSGWYRFLFRELGLEDGDADVSPALSVVTFNYDTSFEHFFQYAVTQSFVGERRAHAMRMIEGIPVLHVHGKLEDYYENDAERTDQWVFEGRELPELKLVFDPELSQIPVWQEARELMGAAEHVMFLGFGYGARNLERLGIRELGSDVKCYGTRYGIPDEEIVRRQVGRDIELGGANETVEVFLERMFGALSLGR